MTKEILIVEDDRTWQGFYREILNEGEYNLTIASNGKEGVKKISEKWFDLIILDIVMEELTGDRIFSLLRRSSIHREVPVIFASVLNKEAYTCTKRLGHVSYLEKPFGKEDLLEEVKKRIAESYWCGKKDCHSCESRNLDSVSNAE